MWQEFSAYFGFTLSTSLCYYCILIFVLTPLARGQGGKAWEPSKQSAFVYRRSIGHELPSRCSEFQPSPGRAKLRVLSTKRNFLYFVFRQRNPQNNVRFTSPTTQQSSGAAQQRADCPLHAAKKIKPEEQANFTMSGRDRSTTVFCLFPMFCVSDWQDVTTNRQNTMDPPPNALKNSVSSFFNPLRQPFTNHAWTNAGPPHHSNGFFIPTKKFTPLYTSTYLHIIFGLLSTGSILQRLSRSALDALRYFSTIFRKQFAPVALWPPLVYILSYLQRR